jgi:hypothetical protein
VIAVGSLAPASGGTVNAIAGALTANGEVGTDTLVVHDGGDTIANTGALTATRLTGLGMGPSGLAYGTLERLTVNLGTANDTFNVVSTAAGTTTTLNGGPGNNVFTGNLTGVIINPQLALAAAPLGDGVQQLAAAAPARGTPALIDWESPPPATELVLALADRPPPLPAVPPAAPPTGARIDWDGPLATLALAPELASALRPALRPS